MNKKPILMNRVMQQHRSSRGDVIGIVGAHSGAGATYTAFLLAFALGEELGRKTAYLECNHSCDLNRIQNSYLWSRDEGYAFSFSNITFYKGVPVSRITEVLNEKYQSYILDFGSGLEQNIDEFLRCNIKIILGDQSEWNWQKFIQFNDSIQGIPGNESWIPIIPCISRKELGRRRRELKRAIYTIPFEPDPTEPSKHTIRLLYQLLNK